VSSEFVEEVARYFREFKCAAQVDNDILMLSLNEQPSEKMCYAELYEVDGAGTLGLKITFSLGEVVDQSSLASVLALNFSVFHDMGPLYGAVIPMEGEPLRFVLVGQLIFPPGTPAQEVATILFHNGFINYALQAITIPGVKMFD
jgi:hypothetical protein